MAETVTKQNTKITYHDQHIEIEREFDAPASRVFAAYTTPAEIEKWWGPAQYETRVDALEPRIGGEWRFTHPDTGQGEHAFRGVFHEVVENERIVQTFEYLGAPGHVSLETMRFEDIGGRTKLTAIAVFGAPEALEAMKASGMEAGMLETYDRLAVLVSD
ncbi:MAG: SRPBCC family protein [Solirubrobacterales bacterium]